jgi:hypothetical protein
MKQNRYGFFPGRKHIYKAKSYTMDLGAFLRKEPETFHDKLLFPIECVC